jgi:hypothetical protein
MSENGAPSGLALAANTHWCYFFRWRGEVKRTPWKGAHKMKASKHVYLVRNRIVYAHCYKKKNPVHRSRADRMYIILDNGHTVTLHAEVARDMAKSLDLEYSRSW